MISTTATPTTKSDTSGSSAGGFGMFIGLVPWALFSVIAHHGSLKLASVLALAAAIVIAFTVDASTANWISRYARGFAAALLALIAFTSLRFTPFTEQYARQAVPQKYWNSPRFHATNRRLTAMWGAIFLAMVPLHVIAGAIDRPFINIALNWVAPVAMVLWGLKHSTTTDGVDDATSTATA